MIAESRSFERVADLSRSFFGVLFRPFKSNTTCALDTRRRAPMASAGSSDVRTQGGRRSGATRPTEDKAARRSVAASGVRGVGERAQLKKEQ